MLEKVRNGGCWLVLLACLALLGWLARPVPPATNWPAASPATREAMARQLAQAASSSWAANHPDRAWEAARVLHGAFPSTPSGKGVAAHLARLEAAARVHARKKKWDYTVLESPGWGRLVQASIASEPFDSPSRPPESHLVVRAGSNPRHRALFFIPGVEMPLQCHEPEGCVVRIESTQVRSYRIRPLAEAPGWWVFSDFHAVVRHLSAPEGVAVHVSSSLAAPLRFDTSGLDSARLSLPEFPASH